MDYTRIYKLTCGHTVSLTRKPRESYCFTCREIFPLIAEFRVKCRDCRYGRQFGQAKIGAQLAADKHHRKTGHRLYLLFNDVVIERRQSNEGQQELF